MQSYGYNRTAVHCWAVLRGITQHRNLEKDQNSKIQLVATKCAPNKWGPPKWGNLW